jgi:pyruvate/2-oxoglutarate/acetoin dehydrogenase E1 component
MALRGLRPVVEIMFGDFVTLLADQLVNHVAKFRWMYSGGKTPQDQVRLPLVIRTPMGGRRGYGPTHSQTLEKIFLGIPGLRIIAPSTMGDPGRLLEHIILESEEPVLFIENKLLYLLPLQDESSLNEFEIRRFPSSPHVGEGDGVAETYLLTLRLAPPPLLTIAAYGYMAELARSAALRLAYEHEIFTELVVPVELAPFSGDPLLVSARRTGRVLFVEEGAATLGWGAEGTARLVEALGNGLKAAARIGSLDLPIPASGPLEAAVLPGEDQIVRRACDIIQGG